MKKLVLSVGIAIIALIAVLVGLNAAEVQAAPPPAPPPALATQGVSGTWQEVGLVCTPTAWAVPPAGHTFYCVPETPVCAVPDTLFVVAANGNFDYVIGADADGCYFYAGLSAIVSDRIITRQHQAWGGTCYAPGNAGPWNIDIDHNADADDWLLLNELNFSWNVPAANPADFSFSSGSVGYTALDLEACGLTSTITCTAISAVDITGPVTITQGKLGLFVANVSPSNATPPISYTWSTQNTAPQPPGGGTTPPSSEEYLTVNDPYFGFYGAVPGTYTVTVEASNCGGSASDSVTVTVISSYVPPFPVVNCNFPVLFIKCDVPQGDGIGGWIQWLWCNQGSWFEYFVGVWLYILCMLYRPFAIVGNGIGEIIYTLFISLGDSIFNLALFFLDWFSKFGQFLLMLVEEVPVCIAGMFGWIADWVNISGPGLATFIEMAVPESVVWLSTLLSWFATDFLTASFGAVLEVAATVINNAGETTQFLTEQFAATVIDAVRMIGYVLLMVTFVLDLLTALVTGLNAALASDTTPEMFEGLTYFWRGLDFFEEVVGESPLALLNVLSLGLIGITLVYWTIGQVAGMIDDMMQV